MVAGSIFTFSLTLGDYITPQIVSSTQFIGNVVYTNVGVANNLPLAAAFATVPVIDHDRLPARSPGASAPSSRSDASLDVARACCCGSGPGITLAFMYVPLLVIALYAFNSRRTLKWPIPGFTLEWFDKAFHNPGVRDALLTSIKAATGATLIALCWARSRRWRSRATASSAARRSRSSSCSRSRCPASSPAWR